jgi:hypothetical protein
VPGSRAGLGDRHDTTREILLMLADWRREPIRTDSAHESARTGPGRHYGGSIMLIISIAFLVTLSAGLLVLSRE